MIIQQEPQFTNQHMLEICQQEREKEEGVYLHGFKRNYNQQHPFCSNTRIYLFTAKLRGENSVLFIYAAMQANDYTNHH